MVIMDLDWIIESLQSIRELHGNTEVEVVGYYGDTPIDRVETVEINGKIVTHIVEVV